MQEPTQIAETRVKTAETDHAKAEAALAEQERLLEELKGEAEAASSRRRQADPFDPKAWRQRQEEDELARAKVAAVAARVVAAREVVAAAQHAAIAARFERGSLLLEGMQAGVLAKRERVKTRAREVAAEIVVVVQELNAASDKAESFALSIRCPEGAEVPELPETRLHRAQLLAREERVKAHAVLDELAEFLRMEEPPLELTEAQTRHIEMVAASEDRRARALFQAAIEREREEAERAAKRRALAARGELPVVREPKEQRDPPDGDYEPAVF